MAINSLLEPVPLSGNTFRRDRSRPVGSFRLLFQLRLQRSAANAYEDRWSSVLRTEETEEMRVLVVQIAKALVDASGEVALDVAEKPESTILRLRVAPEDVGKVIGRQGRTARSIRTLLAAVGMKYHHRFALEIIEEHGLAAPHFAASLVGAR